MDKVKETLRNVFGYSSFREGQSELVESVLRGRDVCGIMPTGAGKSLCYQVPALLLPGVTLVVSPLISLMRDQVQALVSARVPAAYINSSLTDAQCAKAMANARDGKYKIIYIAPERLLTSGIVSLASYVEISMLAVDEAHCISQWGQDFRPAYLDIPEFIENLPRRPIISAFTATATTRVRDDIRRRLQLRDPLVLVTGFDRENLFFSVRKPRDKFAALSRYLRENDNCGIVYCATRKEVDKVAENLAADGYSVAAYHAGLPDSVRSAAQDDFLHDRVKIIVATNAFGMGIDKSNVRFVIHYNMPQNIESYYQEAGRAGRDGLEADCILFYARKDIATAVFLITKSENPEEVRRNRRLLDKIEQYCTFNGCLRRYLLGYFGEKLEDDCGTCGNCVGETDEAEDIAAPKKARTPAQKFAFSDPLFEKLKAVRLEIAKADEVPAFVVFSDAALVDMCRLHPLTPEEFKEVSGVGNVKLERYGEKFLSVLRNEARSTAPQTASSEITPEQLLAEISFEDTPIQITRVAESLNAVLLKHDKPKTSGIALNKLLLEAGYLEAVSGTKLPTPKGRESGITTIRRSGAHGEYEQCLFDENAQRVCAGLVLGI